MNVVERARYLRDTIEKLSVNLTDEEALSNVELFPEWESDKSYEVGERVRYENILYSCLTAHTSQDVWTPTDAPSLWARVLIPDPDVIPDWIQPDSTNPYMRGDKVRYDGKIWVSDIDGNVWVPGQYGWSEVIE